MVPILSRRSIIIIGLGFVVGILIAVAYWLVSPLFIGSASGESPSDSSPDSGNGGLLGILPINADGPFRSTVNVQIVNPGATYLSLSFLQQVAEYYTAKENSLPFFKYLKQELDKYPLETEYTIEDLQRIIDTEYDMTSELPSFNVIATADTEEEAAFFVELVPQIFLDYLIAEEEEKREKEYNDTLDEIESVKVALYEAQQELSVLESPDILDDPGYISLKAKVDALQQEFDNQVGSLALEYYSITDLNEEYENTLREINIVTTELAKAEQELLTFSQQDGDDLTNEVEILVLESKINGLQAQLDLLISGDAETDGLTYYITNGISSGFQYETLMDQIEMTSVALAEAKQEYDALVITMAQPSTISLEQQLAQIKVDTLSAEQNTLREKIGTLYSQIIKINNGNGSNSSTFSSLSLALSEAKKELEALETQLGYDRSYTNLELSVIEAKISNYTDRINELTEQLGTMTGDNVDLLETGYLVAGTPTVPTLVIPERPTASATLLVGAIGGVIIAWIALNFRWLIKTLSLGTTKSEDDEE